MRSFLKWSVLLALWTVIVASDEEPTLNSWKTGNSCNSLYCLERSGHFNHQSFQVESYVLYRSYKLLLSPTFTNFVVYVRNIKNPSKQEHFMQICDGLKCDYLSSAEDQILIYKNVKMVTMCIFSPHTQFEVQYYAGCDVLDETDVTIERQSGSVYTQAGYCWIVIPRLYNGATTQHTAATNIFLTNVIIPRSSQLSIFNVLTGETVMSLKSSTDLDLAMLPRNENATTSQMKKYISTMFLLNVDSCPAEYCSDIAFKLDTQVLSPSDYQCFRKKQACEYGMSNEADENCEGVDVQACSAFQHFEEAVVTALEGETDIAQRSFGGNNCKQIFSGSEVKYFCAKNKKKNYFKCSKFRKCQLYCFTQRIAGICKKSTTAF